MFPSPFLAPIPAPPFEDWGKVPPPTECGEPLVDPTLLSPRITYGAAYLHQGLPPAVWQKRRRNFPMATPSTSSTPFVL